MPLSSTLSRGDYYTIPPFKGLQRMGDKDLARVYGITVGNMHRYIVWEGETDVLDLNLDNLVWISPGHVAVYPDTHPGKHPLRHKLNKAAIDVNGGGASFLNYCTFFCFVFSLLFSISSQDKRANSPRREDRLMHKGLIT